jgi:hypothetical protein
LTSTPTNVARGTRIRIMPGSAPASTAAKVNADFRFPVTGVADTVISVMVENIPFRDNAYVIDETMLNQVFVPDLVAKLDDNGNLTGTGGLHDLTTRVILITPQGTGATVKSTTNQLRVNVELFAQKKPAAKPAAATTTPAAATTAATTPAAASTPATGGNGTATTPASGAAAGAAGAAANATNAATATPTLLGPTTGQAGRPAGTFPMEPPALQTAVPAPRPLPIPRDPGVTRTRRSPSPDPGLPARAMPMPGLAGRTATGSGSDRGVGPGTPSPAAPRGPARAPSASPRPSPAPPTTPSRPPRRSILSRILDRG